MSWKTIFVHANNEDQARLVAPTAVNFAKQNGAHIICAYSFPYVMDIAPIGIATDVGPIIQACERTAKLIEQVIGETARSEGVSFEFHGTGFSEPHYIDRTLHYARLSDAVITTNYHDGEEMVFAHGLTEMLITHAGRPVIVANKDPIDLTKSALVAWDGSQQAARALFDAMPLLKEAPEVQLVQVGRDQTFENVAIPSTEIAACLARHEINVVIIPDGKRPKEAGEEILKIAKGDSCGLIVMGGYGHSRFRESILGGATRHILHHADIPVLFSH